MTFRLSLAIIVGALTVSTTETQAACAFDDFICKKFKGRNAKSATTSQRKKTKRIRRKAKRTQAKEPKKVANPSPVSVESANLAPIIRTPANNRTVASTPPPLAIKPLAPSAAKKVPKTLSSLSFGTTDRFEIASAKCKPTDVANRRIKCAVAIHRLAQTTTSGAICTTTLSLRQIEFTRSETGTWRHDDAIALCGGRLLRRTELFPVSLNGQERYALRETNKLHGGNDICAAPYLRSRAPLNKSYFPGKKTQAGGLRCNTVLAQQ